MREAGEIAWLVLVGGLSVAAPLALGLWLARAIGAAERGAERAALAYALGTGAASLALLGLRALDVPVPPWALAGVALAGLPAARDLRAPTAPARDATPGWVRLVDAASLALAALLFVAALGPETAWDGFEYHLPIAQAWAGGPVRALPGMIDAELRAGVDLLYVPAVAAGAPDAAAALSAGFASALAAWVRAEARRRAGAAAGSLAGLFALGVPFTLAGGVATTVDLAVGLYGFGALLCADRWNRGGPARDLVLSAVLAAFAANAKLHAAVLAPALGVLLVFGGRRPPLRRLAGCAALGAALAAPWLVKSGLTTGNPLFPLFGEWLGYGPTDAVHLAWKRADTYYYVHVERSAAGFLRYLASLTFGHTYHVSGLLGPLPLALAPFAAHRLARPTAWLAGLLAVLFGLQFVFMPALRFGAPLLPFVAVAAAVGGARVARSGTLARGVLALALVACALGFAAGAAVRLLPRVAALRDPTGYERAAHPAQDALRRVVARGTPVVAIPRGAVSWMPQPVYVLHWSRNGELFFDARTPPDEALALLRERGVRSLVIDAKTAGVPPGRVGHPIVDAWLAAGRAELVPDPHPLPAQRGRVWRLVELR